MSGMHENEINKRITGCYYESVEYTKILSNICRQIAFAEGSLFWFLKLNLEVNILFISLGFLMLLLFFFFDALQYYRGYKKFEKQAEKFENYKRNGKYAKELYEDDSDLHAPISAPFKLKLFFLGLSTLMLLVGFFWGICFHH